MSTPGKEPRQPEQLASSPRRYPRWLLWVIAAVLVAANGLLLARNIPGLVEHILGEQPYGVIRHEITVELPWPTQVVDIHDRFTVLFREDLDSVELAFSLRNVVRVQRAQLPDGRDLHYTQNSFQLGLRPPAGDTWASLAGEDRTLAIDLHLKIAASSDNGIGLTKRGLFLAHSDGWLPVTSELSLGNTGVLRVHHPPGLPVAASGIYSGQPVLPAATLAPEVPPPDMVTSEWFWDRPLSVLIALVASPDYTVVPDGAAQPTVLYYAFSAETETAAEIAGRAAKYVEHLSSILGHSPPLPYRIVLAPRDGHAVAQGHYGLTTLFQSPGSGGGGGGATASTWALASVAHEIAHHWWGHVCQLYHARGGIALAEGMAEYWSSRCLLDLGDKAGVSWYAANRQRAWRMEFSSKGDKIPLSRVWLPSSLIGAQHITYLKAGAALQALEWFVGRDAFDEACRSMVAACDHGPGTLDDFRRHIEAATRRDDDLAVFWKRWFDGTGVPALVRTQAEAVAIQTIRVGDTGDTSAAGVPGIIPGFAPGPAWQLRLEIEQGGVPFPMRMPAEVYYSDGTVEPLWVEVQAERVSRMEILLGHDSDPERIRLDPLRLGLYDNEERDLTGLLTVRVTGTTGR